LLQCASKAAPDRSIRFCGDLSEIAGADGDISLIMKASMRWVSKRFEPSQEGKESVATSDNLALELE
jgi:hypothetical protein